MHFLKRAWIWTTRIGRSRGFGVQSPNDYRFLRYVIGEPLPYYKYEVLKNTVTDIGRSMRKLCQLYFRVANYCQPAVFVDVSPETAAYQKYVTAGCERTQVAATHAAAPADFPDVAGVVLARMDARQEVESTLGLLLREAPVGSIVILQGIYESDEARKLWQTAAGHERVGVAYDLYVCGVLLMEHRQYKKCYKVNF